MYQLDKMFIKWCWWLEQDFWLNSFLQTGKKAYIIVKPIYFLLWLGLDIVITYSFFSYGPQCPRNGLVVPFKTQRCTVWKPLIQIVACILSQLSMHNQKEIDFTVVSIHWKLRGFHSLRINLILKYNFALTSVS